MKITEVSALHQIKDDKFVIIFSSKSYCAACKILDRTINEMSLTPFNIYSINIDMHPEETINYSITCLPTILFISSGKVVSELTGSVTAETLSKEMEVLL